MDTHQRKIDAYSLRQMRIGCHRIRIGRRLGFFDEHAEDAPLARVEGLPLALRSFARLLIRHDRFLI